MSGQPRQPKSQQFGARRNTPPLSELLPAEEQGFAEFVFDRMDELFDQIEVIAEEGAERFFAADYLLGNAAIGALIQLGELAKKLPRDFVDAHPETNYRGMAQLRDKLAHLHEHVDWGIVWNSVNSTVPRDAALHRRARTDWR